MNPNRNRRDRFEGIPFNKDRPYNFREAERLIRQVMEELCSHKDLVKRLEIGGWGPPSIINNGWGVWRYASLKRFGHDEEFYNFPHLAICIGHNKALAHLVFPNALKAELRRIVDRLVKGPFLDLLFQIRTEMPNRLGAFEGYAPWIEVFQRRGRGSGMIADALIEFDMRTAFKGHGDNENEKIKHQPQWFQAAVSAWGSRNANLQWTTGAMFNYEKCEFLRTREALDAFAGAWLSCRPLIDAIR